MQRRDLLKTIGAAGLLAGLLPQKAEAQSTPAEAPPSSRPLHPVAISSANGIGAVEVAVNGMINAADPLDAAIAGVNLVEADPDDTSVGLGGLPNEAGVVELDASVMHGPSHNAGAVASLQGFVHPSKIAKLVMERTDHVLLVSEGARAFAKAHGFQEQDLLTERARKTWLAWKESLSDGDDWLPPSDTDDAEPWLQDAYERYQTRDTGTINCCAVDMAGDLGGVTTTSGLSFKIPGRVGDSPIIGAGLYVDNEVGACGSTGRGEANLLNLSSYLAVEQMRLGKSPKEAGLEVCVRIAEKTLDPELLDEEGRPAFNVRFYILNKSGDYAGCALHAGEGVQFSVCDQDGPRREPMIGLYQS